MTGKPPFDLRGGNLALDFVNTMGGMRVVKETEHLTDYADLVRFAEQSRAIDKRAAARALAQGELQPKRAAKALAEAIALREALHDVLLAAVNRKPVDPAALAAVDRWIASAQSERELRRTSGDGYALALRESDDPLAPLRPVALAAGELLTSPALGRVGLCGEWQVERCGWLFLDETKNHSRRFCSADDCGNRAKQRRHYQKTRAAQKA
jgi:predicted RNA-binding Zn ribbon-like protein